MVRRVQFVARFLLCKFLCVKTMTNRHRSDDDDDPFSTRPVPQPIFVSEMKAEFTSGPNMT
jgi:hypothetical protein